MVSKEVDPSSEREQVETALERILGSAEFSKSKRLRDFLRFTVSEVLRGHPEGVSEWAVGVAAYKRDVSYDPQIDSIVRSEARRLRAKLREYYASEGATDPLLIDYPKGTYIPVLRWREPEISAADATPKPIRRAPWADWIVTVAAITAVATAGKAAVKISSWFLRRLHKELEAPS